MKQIIIIGAGGHSAEIDDYFQYAKKKLQDFGMEIRGYIDDNALSYGNYDFTAPFLGHIQSHVIQQDVYYIMGIANLKYRRPIIERFLAAGAVFTTFIHPDAYISASSKIGAGVVIAPGVNVGPKVSIGNFTLINSRSSMGHDTKVGAYNFICPNVCFSGFTVVGDENLFGVNSATIPGIQIGNRNKIAAGVVLDKNVGDDEVVFYRFKEKVIAIPKSQ
ncbi:MAG: sugar O-acyltransferase [Ferruginibacter sp.]|uniref:acetyltransferase n=1 Tax=Ferruginibacter sp. TaxID=1940288 RepID=UPI002659B324|nr:acetyltransferase [Ferruginibacter sp.]MDB5275525.1 sugar O-acyltransferase [Ferruginibacter sp.]